MNTIKVALIALPFLAGCICQLDPRIDELFSDSPTYEGVGTGGGGMASVSSSTSTVSASSSVSSSASTSASISSTSSSSSSGAVSSSSGAMAPQPIRCKINTDMQLGGWDNWNGQVFEGCNGAPFTVDGKLAGQSFLIVYWTDKAHQNLVSCQMALPDNRPPCSVGDNCAVYPMADVQPSVVINGLCL